MLSKFLLAGLTVAALTTGAAYAAECTLPADAQAGKSVSNQCKSCHVFEADKPSRPTAPNIHDVFESLPASRTDFKYSDGMTGAAAKKATWTEANLSEYLLDPKAYLAKVNGGPVPFKMIFTLKDEQKRKDLIAFLKAIKGHPECN